MPGRRLALVAIGAGLAAGGSATAWALDDESRSPWRVFKVASLTWTVTDAVELDGPEGSQCQTPVKLVGKSSPFYVGTPAVRKPHIGSPSGWIRFAKTARPLLLRGSSVPAWDLKLRIPASMTLTIGATTCDPPADIGSCAGTFRSRGGVIGAIMWIGTVGHQGMDWSHKIAAPQPLPPQSCGPFLGRDLFGYFFSGLYHPVGGGAFEHPGGPRVVPLPRSQLRAGKPFATHQRAAAVTADATFVPVRP